MRLVWLFVPLGLIACSGGRSPKNAPDLRIEIVRGSLGLGEEGDEPRFSVRLASDEACLFIKEEPVFSLDGEPVPIDLQSEGGRGFDVVNGNRLCGDPAWRVPGLASRPGPVDVDIEVDGGAFSFTVLGLLERPELEIEGDLGPSNTVTFLHRHADGESELDRAEITLDPQTDPGDITAGNYFYSGPVPGTLTPGPGIQVVVPEVCAAESWALDMPGVLAPVVPETDADYAVQVKLLRGHGIQIPAEEDAPLCVTPSEG